MTKPKKIYVAGGGFGGIASALRMRAKGYEVVLLERGDQLGGRARVFKQDGFVFDAGPTVITAPYLIDELFKLFNKSSKDYFNLINLPHWYRYYFSDNTCFDYVADEKELLKNIQQISLEDVDGFKALLKHAEKIYETAFFNLGGRAFLTIFSMFSQMAVFITLGLYRTLYSSVSQHLKSEKLRKVFTTQALLIGGSPFTVSSLYLLILALERKGGCYFSQGGTNRIVAGLEKLMREEGIEIRFNSTVTAINHNKNKLASIEINNKQLIYPKRLGFRCNLIQIRHSSATSIPFHGL